MSDQHLPKISELQEKDSFTSELIKSRSDLGLTQSQLSIKSGLSLSAIKAYESGRNMPGARELRELSQVLQVSPNKLLFGKELPFKAQSVLGAALDNEFEQDAVNAARIAALFTMLASDEQKAIFLLAQSLATARRGIAVVKQTLMATDFVVGAQISVMEQNKGINKEGKNFKIDPDKTAADTDAFMKLRGHIPESKKLPKK